MVGAVRDDYYYNNIKVNTMYSEIKNHLTAELQSIKEAGLYKNERIITSLLPPTWMSARWGEVIILSFL